MMNKYCARWMQRNLFHITKNIKDRADEWRYQTQITMHCVISVSRRYIDRNGAQNCVRRICAAI